MSHSAVNNYEKGDVPPADFVLAVAQAFSVDAGWLLEGDEGGEKPEEIRDLKEVRHRLEDLLARIADV